MKHQYPGLRISRFPFAFPCKNTSIETIQKCLLQLFSLFGMPNYIHSDMGSSLISNELHNYLLSYNVAMSQSAPYNPRRNRQVERYNFIIWKTVNLALSSQNLNDKQWELVLPDALHWIRTLCTSRNAIPHEWFFKFQRKSTTGQAVPTWLSEPGKIFVKKHQKK